MQICTSLKTDNHASTPPLSFLQTGCPSCRPTNSVKALKHLRQYLLLIIIITISRTLRTLMPYVRCPCAWWFRSSVTVEIGFSPAFSANVNGITSRASANARKQYCSIPLSVCECSSRRIASSISGAPPPAISALQPPSPSHTTATTTTTTTTTTTATTTPN